MTATDELRTARERRCGMSEKRICKTCGWHDTNNGGCKYGVMDRYRGIKEPCGWWKRKRITCGERKAVTP